MDPDAEMRPMTPPPGTFDTEAPWTAGLVKFRGGDGKTSSLISKGLGTGRNQRAPAEGADAGCGQIWSLFTSRLHRHKRVYAVDISE